MKEKPAVLKPDEVAEIFQVNRDTVLRWTRAGLLPAFRTLGGQWRYYAEQIEKELGG